MKKDFKANILAWAIAIVLVIFVAVGVSTFYKEPEYEDCFRPVAIEPNTNIKLSPEEIQEQKDCLDRNEVLRKTHSRNVFTVFLVAGFLALVIGLLLKNNKVVSFGLSVGGIANIIIGFLFYWRYLGDYIRFIAVTILLIILIWLAYKKMR